MHHAIKKNMAGEAGRDRGYEQARTEIRYKRTGKTHNITTNTSEKIHKIRVSKTGTYGENMSERSERLLREESCECFDKFGANSKVMT